MFSKKYKIAFSLFFIGHSIAALAALDADTAKQLTERFAAADKDKDGKLNRAEADAGMPRIARAYVKIDTDGRGYITLDQIKSFVCSR